MHHIHVIGAGSLGSTFCNEMARRILALEIPGMKMTIWDYDTVDSGRNLTAQMFHPEHDGMNKAEVVRDSIASIMKMAGAEVEARGKLLKLPDLGDTDIVVDMVDHYPTRIATDKAPIVFHAGMSESGDGMVTWTTKKWPSGERTTWNLAPHALSSTALQSLMKHESDVKLPPCVLSSLRGLIWNTAFATVEAVTLYMGRDPYGHVVDEHGVKIEERGMLTTWRATPTGFSLVDEWTEIEGE